MSVLLDSTVAHALGLAHALAGDFESDSLVGCDTLVIGAKVRLNLLPHFLLGVKLLVWFTCKAKFDVLYHKQSSSRSVVDLDVSGGQRSSVHSSLNSFISWPLWTDSRLGYSLLGRPAYLLAFETTLISP